MFKGSLPRFPLMMQSVLQGSACADRKQLGLSGLRELPEESCKASSPGGCELPEEPWQASSPGGCLLPYADKRECASFQRFQTLPPRRRTSHCFWLFLRNTTVPKLTPQPSEPSTFFFFFLPNLQCRCYSLLFFKDLEKLQEVSKEIGRLCGA